MSIELVYTSAPKGLKPGTSGFCTVAASAGMSRQILMKLELLSGYDLCFDISDPRADQNPVDFSHLHVEVGGRKRSVLSRVAFSGADYSGRANKIAHHFLLGEEERLPAGPAWMLSQLAKGIFRCDWDDQPRDLQAQPLVQLPGGREVVGGMVPDHWERLTGDPGWAGMLAKAFRDSKKIPAYVIFQPGVDLLPLFLESLAVLPPDERWNVCFATYYTRMPPGTSCHWRGVVANSPAAREIGRFPNATVIDLTAPLERPQDNEFVTAAREGRSVPSLVAAGLDTKRKIGKRPPPEHKASRKATAQVAAALGGNAPLHAVPAGLLHADGSASAQERPRRTRIPVALIAVAALFMIAAAGLAWLLWQAQKEVASSSAELANERASRIAAEEKVGGIADLRDRLARSGKLSNTLNAKLNDVREDLNSKINEQKEKADTAERERDGWKDKYEKLQAKSASPATTTRPTAQSSTEKPPKVEPQAPVRLSTISREKILDIATRQPVEYLNMVSTGSARDCVWKTPKAVNAVLGLPECLGDYFSIVEGPKAITFKRTKSEMIKYDVFTVTPSKGGKDAAELRFSLADGWSDSGGMSLRQRLVDMVVELATPTKDRVYRVCLGPVRPMPVPTIVELPRTTGNDANFLQVENGWLEQCTATLKCPGPGRGLNGRISELIPEKPDTKAKSGTVRAELFALSDTQRPQPFGFTLRREGNKLTARTSGFTRKIIEAVRKYLEKKDSATQKKVVTLLTEVVRHIADHQSELERSVKAWKSSRNKDNAASVVRSADKLLELDRLLSVTEITDLFDAVARLKQTSLAVKDPWGCTLASARFKMARKGIEVVFKAGDCVTTTQKCLRDHRNAIKQARAKPKK